ncbi:MAG: guanylate kinase [Pseudomonadales bacterium]
MTQTAPTTGLLIVVAAPSGAGKTSLVAALRQAKPSLSLSVSHTTRPMRPGEQDGVNYHFVTAERFRALVDQGEFVEHAEVFGNYYGTSKSALATALAAGQDVILEIDWQGAEQVRATFSDNLVSIFIMPPSLESLKERLNQRGQDQPEVINTRMANAVADMTHHQDFDYVIVNDQFETAAAELTAVVSAEPLRQRRQQQRHAALFASLTGRG